MTDLREIILTLPVFLLAISLHEYAHAFTAVKLGDPTPRYQGRLTLNFLAHFSWVGTLMLLIAGIGWAKPVQINTRNLKNPRMDTLWISLAGPLSNMFLAVAFSLLFRLSAPLLPAGPVGQSTGFLLYLGVRLNLLLAFFNLIPVPPLDGAKVLAPLIPYRWAVMLQHLESWGFVIIYLLLRHFGLGRLLLSLTGAGLRLLL